MNKRIRLVIAGRVQGVGFRPSVFRHASGLRLAGFVTNTASGVIAEAEGPASDVEEFRRLVAERPPPQARIASIRAESVPCRGESAFVIAASRRAMEMGAGLPSDLAVCADCARELLDPGDRRRRYPFINCTNCGPRFTIVRSLPYDRERTSMAKFEMCAKCRAEYENPADRRFDAQPNACPVCGPRATLQTASGQTMDCADPIAEAARLLSRGAILAVKGLGGFHLSCDAGNAAAVLELRRRKNRPAKAFAVMFRSIEQLRRHCEVSEAEARELDGWSAPIAILKRRSPEPPGVCREVSPDTDDVGVMLPYTPLHLLLLAETGPLVMTSGNMSDEPVAIDDEELTPLLGAVADFALTHNRPIARRCDDSVLRMVSLPARPGNGAQPETRRLFLRRSRGFVPDPLTLPFPCPPMLACGADLKNVFCVAAGDRAFPSQHIGDLSDPRCFEFYANGIRDFLELLRVKPEAVAYDMHPGYRSTRYALGFEAPVKLAVQHHHAHVAAVMREHGLKTKAIGVALDGTGFGPDGTMWGGEFFVCDFAGYRRAASFKQYRLPGGDAAVLHPGRMAYSVLLAEAPDKAGEIALRLLPGIAEQDRAVIRAMVAKGINSPLTSSAGRLFDAVSALLGNAGEISYEAQAAIRLQRLAEKGAGEPYPHELNDVEGRVEVSMGPAFRRIVADVLAGKPPERIAAGFHATVAAAVAGTCAELRRAENINIVILSGGVFQNDLLLRLTLAELGKRDFEAYFPSALPPNDAAIAAGQAAIAAAMLVQG